VSKKTGNELLPFLQEDRMSNKLWVVQATTMNSILVLPSKFPENCTVNDVQDLVVFTPQSSWDTLGWPDY
jgi:hypothetical protein